MKKGLERKPKRKSLWGRLESIVRRCYDKQDHRYRDFGGRGIGVCREWYDPETGKLDADAFGDWAYANGYEEGLLIGRKDVDGPYAPWNCRFVTAHETSRNRRSTNNIEIDGRTKCAKDWCEVFGIAYVAAAERIRRGWDLKRAVMIPSGDRRPSLCFNRGVRGGCRRPGVRKGKIRCHCCTDGEMRGCLYFDEYLPEDNPRYREWLEREVSAGGGKGSPGDSCRC